MVTKLQAGSSMSDKGNCAAIDGLELREYSENQGKLVAVKSIKLGQVWRQDTTGQDHLVTKVYSEVFTQYAVLRPADITAPDAPIVKVKVAKSADGVTLPGFSFTQEGAF
ncbi:MAG: hypothetical protein ABSD76_01950 [Terriglobales bacterium]|jgi:hypothetical protein